MDSTQAGTLIVQNDKLLALYGQIVPLVQVVVHDVFPLVVVAICCALGAVMAWAATA